MADRITWYDILEVAPGASPETVQRANEAKAEQLQNYCCPVPHLTAPWHSLPVTRAAVPALVLMVLVLVAVLAGCGLGRLPEGPLGNRPENHQVVGEPVRKGGAATIGWDVFFNGGPAPAVIDRLVVVSPRHIKLIGAYVTIGGPVGNWVTFPPSFPRSASGRRENRYAISRWAHRHKIAGAIVPPHQWAGIALGLEATSAHGSIAGIDVFYHVGSAHYEWHGHVRIVLTSVDCRVPASAPARTFCRLYDPPSDGPRQARRGLRTATAAAVRTPGNKSMPIEGSASTAAIPRITGPHISTHLDRRPAVASSSDTAPAPTMARYHQYGVLP